MSKDEQESAPQGGQTPVVPDDEGLRLAALDAAEIAEAGNRRVDAMLFRALAQRFQHILRELAALRAEHHSLRGALERFIELSDTPERNCSCHVSPPCSDCIEYGAIREAVADAHAALGAKPR